MSRLLWLPIVLTLGCAPPPVPDGVAGDPSITLLYPPRDAPSLPLDADGRLSFLVVVDVNNLEFVTPSDSNVDVEGQGHYHLTINDVYVGAPPNLYYQFTSNVDEYTAEQQISVRVSLQSNTHKDLDASPDWEDIVEYEVGDALVP